MPVSGTQFVMNTSAAPICGGSGSQQVATEMAAIEVLRRGYDRYMIESAGTQNNVGMVQTGPTHATTSHSGYGTYSGYGGTGYGTYSGSSTTTFHGQRTMVFGSHDTELLVTMLHPQDPYYYYGIDARSVLGPDWESKVRNGVGTCW